MYSRLSWRQLGFLSRTKRRYEIPTGSPMKAAIEIRAFSAGAFRATYSCCKQCRRRYNVANSWSAINRRRRRVLLQTMKQSDEDCLTHARKLIVVGQLIVWSTFFATYKAYSIQWTTLIAKANGWMTSRASDCVDCSASCLIRQLLKVTVHIILFLCN